MNRKEKSKKLKMDNNNINNINCTFNNNSNNNISPSKWNTGINRDILGIIFSFVFSKTSKLQQSIFIKKLSNIYLLNKHYNNLLKYNPLIWNQYYWVIIGQSLIKKYYNNLFFSNSFLKYVQDVTIYIDFEYYTDIYLNKITDVVKHLLYIRELRFETDVYPPCYILDKQITDQYIENVNNMVTMCFQHLNSIKSFNRSSPNFNNNNYDVERNNIMFNLQNIKHEKQLDIISIANPTELSITLNVNLPKIYTKVADVLINNTNLQILGLNGLKDCMIDMLILAFTSICAHVQEIHLIFHNSLDDNEPGKIRTLYMSLTLFKQLKHIAILFTSTKWFHSNVKFQDYSFIPNTLEYIHMPITDLNDTFQTNVNLKQLCNLYIDDAKTFSYIVSNCPNLIELHIFIACDIQSIGMIANEILLLQKLVHLEELYITWDDRNLFNSMPNTSNDSNSRWFSKSKHDIVAKNKAQIVNFFFVFNNIYIVD